jgi:hypothetical protein
MRDFGSSSTALSTAWRANDSVSLTSISSIDHDVLGFTRRRFIVLVTAVAALRAFAFGTVSNGRIPPSKKTDRVEIGLIPLRRARFEASSLLNHEPRDYARGL